MRNRNSATVYIRAVTSSAMTAIGTPGAGMRLSASSASATRRLTWPTRMSTTGARCAGERTNRTTKIPVALTASAKTYTEAMTPSGAISPRTIPSNQRSDQMRLPPFTR